MAGKAVATAPTEEPVTVPEVKSHVRQTLEIDDGVLGDLLAAVRYYVEHSVLGRALITQTWDYWLDAFPIAQTFFPLNVQWQSWAPQTVDRTAARSGHFIKLPLPPLRSVTHVRYYDVDEVQATFASSSYQVDTVSTPGAIVLHDGQAWPSTVLRPRNGVEIRLEAGYGDRNDVPEDIKLGIKMLVGSAYENREADLGVLLRANPMAMRLLMPYRLTEYAFA